MSNRMIFTAKIKNAIDKINTFGFLDILYDNKVIRNNNMTIPIMVISRYNVSSSMVKPHVTA